MNPKVLRRIARRISHSAMMRLGSQLAQATKVYISRLCMCTTCGSSNTYVRSVIAESVSA